MCAIGGGLSPHWGKTRDSSDKTLSALSQPGGALPDVWTLFLACAGLLVPTSVCTCLDPMPRVKHLSVLGESQYTHAPSIPEKKLSRSCLQAHGANCRGGDVTRCQDRHLFMFNSPANLRAILPTTSPFVWPPLAKHAQSRY